jgi:hypothetical protein
MKDVEKYNAGLEGEPRKIVDFLVAEFEQALPEATAKVWHSHPVWFFDDQPAVGYQATAHGVKVLFWHGQDFSEPGLLPTGKFRMAVLTYTSAAAITITDLRRYLQLSKETF